MRVEEFPIVSEEVALRKAAQTVVYEPHDSVLAKYDALVDNLLVKKHIIGTTVENRPIPMYQFGTGQVKILLDACLHGGEDMGAELFLKWVKTILSIHSPILNHCSIYIVPVVNRDRTGRPNANYVNLNRNFAYGWSGAAEKPWCKTNATSQQTSHYVYDPMVGDPEHGYPPTWTNPAGVVKNYLPFEVLPSTWTCPVCGALKSTFFNSQNWHGPSAASEPETQAMRNVFATLKPHIYVNTHQGGGPYLAGLVPSSDTVMRTTMTEIKNEIITRSAELGVTPYPFYIWGLSAGMADSDAYNAGIIDFQLEWTGAEWAPPLEEVLSTYYNKWVAIGDVLCGCELTPQPSILPLLVIVGLFFLAISQK